MTDLQHLFESFHHSIALSDAQKLALHFVRDRVRDRIRTCFRSVINLPSPVFRPQGAWAMETVINPIDGEYAVDDGIYLQHLDPEDDSTWPEAEIVHQWLLTGAGGNTDERIEDKRACVRIRHPGRYRLDLSPYGRCGKELFLAAKGDILWPRSNPLAIAQWFASKIHLHGGQLLRVVRYLKAWADYQSPRLGKMPCGLILTVFAANHFRPDKRDDVALAETVRAMAKTMSAIVFALNPVDFTEVLTEQLSEEQKDRFRAAVRAAAGDMAAAVAEKKVGASVRLWQRQFGGRFSM